MSNSNSPRTPDLSEKNQKYDRQIRLWGDHGQTLLESAKVCLINGNALGTEILKGIILPGIGSFTIVDKGIVTEEDIGNNFFLDASCLGLPRAKCTMQLLQELNPDVSGDYIDDGIESIIKNNQEFLSGFDVVVVANFISEKCLKELSEILWTYNIPFIYCRSIGFLASARLQYREHCVIETHPDNRHYDLRFEMPFDSLKSHLDSIDSLAKEPWLVVLYKYLQKWNNQQKIPKTYKEKSELRELIQSDMVKDEDNYDEAIRAVNTSFCGMGKVNGNLKRILDDDCCVNLTKNSNPFWIKVRALKDFILTEGNGSWLPLSGQLPDMTADTLKYILLQNLYRKQAQNDCDIIYGRVKDILKELNLSSDLISEQDINIFCREAFYIEVLRGTKLADEYNIGVIDSNNMVGAGNANTKDYVYDDKEILRIITSECEMQNSLIEFYIGLRAVDKFYTEHGSLPGDSQIEADTSRVKFLANKLIGEWGGGASCGTGITLSNDLIHEICRYGGSEIHSISAFMGGCVAHEIIKLITKQYKPINNTIIYNAITSETSVYKL